MKPNEKKKIQNAGGNLAASNIRNLECPSYEVYLIDYGCGKFTKKYTLWNNVHDLRSRGLNITRTAQRLGISRDTVRHLQHLSSEELFQKCRSIRPCKLHAYEQEVLSLLNCFPSISSSRVHDYLKEHHPAFPKVCEKTVHNYVQFIRRKYHILSTR